MHKISQVLLGRNKLQFLSPGFRVRKTFAEQTRLSKARLNGRVEEVPEINLIY